MELLSKTSKLKKKLGRFQEKIKFLRNCQSFRFLPINFRFKNHFGIPDLDKFLEETGFASLKKVRDCHYRTLRDLDVTIASNLDSIGQLVSEEHMVIVENFLDLDYARERHKF